MALFPPAVEQAVWKSFSLFDALDSGRSTSNARSAFALNGPDPPGAQQIHRRVLTVHGRRQRATNPSSHRLDHPFVRAQGTQSNSRVVYRPNGSWRYGPVAGIPVYGSVVGSGTGNPQRASSYNGTRSIRYCVN